MIVFWLHLGRYAALIAGFVVPILVGLGVVGLTFWFATWWPPLFGMEGRAFFLAAFITSWGLLPYFWVVEFAAAVKHIDKILGSALMILERELAKRGVPVL